jgi:hypothetical protein
MRFITALLLCMYAACQAATCQEAVFFYAEDSTEVRGDLYIKNNALPFIILCHDETNRNEYDDLTLRLLNLNYNCLSVIMRSEISLGSSADIKAAIKYAQHICSKPVILLGSTYSASLCLITATQNPSVKAIIALNPGEYFLPHKTISEEVKKLNQPVFVSSTQTEFPYVQKMLAAMPSDHVTLFKPEKGKGIRGPGAFYKSNPNNGEYWFALMMFFKKIEG